MAKPPPGIQPKGFTLICAKDVIVRPIDWIWEGHLQRGALELMTGLPGLGKSQVHCSFVARVTTKLAWPNGEDSGPASNVIMLTAEDTVDQAVVPRLQAAEADVSRVHILKCIKSDGKDRQFLLGEDLDILEKMVVQIGSVALVTIDPITAYLGGRMDSHKATEVRSQLGPLKDFAERTNIATSAITHPPKSSSQKAIDHFIGSQAFIAACRVGHLCIAEMEDDGDGDKVETGRVLFAHVKYNNSVKMPTLVFRKEEMILHGSSESPWTIIKAPRVVWDKNPVDITADEAIRAAKSGDRGEQKKVQAFLRKLLQNGQPMAVKTIMEEGAKHGYSEKQLRSAKEELGIKSVKTAEGCWTWQLIPF